MSDGPQVTPFGWIRQLPSEKDFGLDHPTSKTLLSALCTGAVRPQSVDLSAFDVPVVDQGPLGSCTANAYAGLLGWYIKKNFGITFVASRLHTYYKTRELEGSPVSQDTGASIRGTVGAGAIFGVPPEVSSLKGITWPYNVTKFGQAPPMDCCLAALNWQGTTYALIDKPGIGDKLQAVKAVLAAGAPMEFGFDVFSNYGTASKTGIFDIPGAGDTIVGGHAVLAVGYDDMKGALVIKNSWGATGRPDKRGYYYLPYWYLNNNHAADFWTLTGARFLNAGQFSF